MYRKVHILGVQVHNVQFGATGTRRQGKDWRCARLCSGNERQRELICLSNAHAHANFPRWFHWTTIQVVQCDTSQRMPGHRHIPLSTTRRTESTFLFVKNESIKFCCSGGFSNVPDVMEASVLFISTVFHVRSVSCRCLYLGFRAPCAARVTRVTCSKRSLLGVPLELE